MGVLFQGGSGRSCGWLSAVAMLGILAGGVRPASAWMPGMRVEGARRSPWDAAVEVRERFEAEPTGTHTRSEYAEVMEEFRAIYHADPGDAHAARAVMQVAELLAEQGRELGDAKSLQDAARQYEFLAKAYPGGSMAPRALKQAIDLLGPENAVEARRLTVELAEDYPRYARSPALNSARTAREADAGGAASGAASGAAEETAGLSAASAKNADSGRDDRSGGVKSADFGRDDRLARAGEADASPFDELRVRHDKPGLIRESTDLGRVIPEVAVKEQTGPLAVVTGIRHWSTASYTRVAIDLNVGSGNGDSREDVRYEAARVEHPNRIFFDLQHARLAPQLAGRSFTVTDDGFLTRIRAAQFSDDVTRVVLDVHEVAEYSAFLLPNPYRLIIDIHGNAAAPNKEDAAVDRAQVVGNSGGADGKANTGVSALRPHEAADFGRDDGNVAGRTEMGGAETVSSLPPMPVTDGSAGFGLPVRSAAERIVARPRVVISSKPTAARPVPNTVTKSSKETGVEVAEVSDQPGKVEATPRPTSKPIAEKSYDVAASGRVSPVERTASTGVAPLPSQDHPMRAKTGRGGPRSAANSGREDGDQGSVAAAPAAAAPPTADGETSLTRALGLKIGRIVIDAGHGGHDSGTLGVGGIEEKNVVLDVALRLGKLLHDRLGADVVYTRADDTFIPLETRTAIANKAQADLFISVHANSSQDADARGVEVYYLNFTSDPEAMTVASRENAVSTERVHELSDLVKKIALRDKIDESRELASDVDASLYAGLRRGNAGLKDRGVKKAPFVVLIGANMPSILAEISFVTNPTDAAKLETPEYRQRVAESLYKGIARYAEGINGVRPKLRSVEQASYGSARVAVACR